MTAGLNPFEQIADAQQNAYSKARDRGAARRLAKLVVQSEADAPMVASPADKAVFERSQQMQNYRRQMRLRQEELVKGPNGREVGALIALLETLTASSAAALVSYVMKAEWLAKADLSTRLDVLALIGTAIARFRVRAGLPPFDDALPGEPPTAFEQIRLSLTGVGHHSVGDKFVTNPGCPKCGSDAMPTMTRFGMRHDHCGLWSWDGAPLVDADTHEARKRAHEAFDEIWKTGRVTRAIAYKMLAEKLNVERKDCHIKLMSADTASRVPEIAKLIIASLEEPGS